MIEPFQHRFPREEFDYQTLLDVLQDYSRPRDKITDLIRKGIIIRVKKGLYVLGDRFRTRPFSKELLANLIFGPSYISLEYALQYYGMIPERVEAVTSVTTGRSRRFMTPLGLFTYRNIPLPAFHYGMNRIEYNDTTSFLMAIPEKALCDKIRNDQNTGLRSLKDMRHYLLEELRIDETALADLNHKHIENIAQYYGSGKLKLLHKFIAGIKK
jgi:hypothetical protein